MGKSARMLGYAAAGIAIFAAGVGVGYDRWHRPPCPPPPARQIEQMVDTRVLQVTQAAAAAGRVDFVVLGDSIAASVYLDSACGRGFNAAVPAARIADVAGVAAAVLPKLRPHILLVAVGTNDLRAGDAGLAGFRQDYASLVAGLPAAQILLMGVPNSAAASADIERIARDRGFGYVPPVTGQGATIADGIHLTRAGAERFRSRIAAACGRATTGPAGLQPPGQAPG